MALISVPSEWELRFEPALEPMRGFFSDCFRFQRCTRLAYRCKASPHHPKELHADFLLASLSTTL